MGQGRIRKPRTESYRRDYGTQVHETKREQSEAEAVKAELDELLADLDDLLEENAQEFIDGFTQISGE